jgi:T5SS/PEP-CTERM-associated repeat protein
MKQHAIPVGKLLCLVTAALLGAPQARGQFSGSYQTNTINGLLSSWPGDYVVGSNAVFDVVLIENGGTLVSSGSHIGYAGTNNSAVLRDIGSIWKTVFVYVGDAVGGGNSLVITNGGRVANEGLARIGRFGSNNNRVLVSGSGSSWRNTNDLTIGEIASGNSLVISNGAGVDDRFASIGDSGANSNNSVTVTGTGSVWTNRSSLNVGAGAVSNSVVIRDGGVVLSGDGNIGYAGGRASRVAVNDVGSLWNCQGNLVIGLFTSEHTLAISNGGLVIAANLYVGYGTSSSNNLVSLDSGSLVVTNGSGSGVLSVLNGSVRLNGGTVTVDQLFVTNTFTFNKGTVHSAATSVTNGQQFVVGDSTSVANLNLLGGLHSFNDGLRIANNAVLTGCGTINGTVVVDAGGAAFADCSPLVFTQSLTNNGSLRAINGNVLEAYDTVVNNGTIDLINGGITNFHGTFINNGVVLDSNSVVVAQISDSSNDIVAQIQSVSGHTYQLQVRDALDASTWSDILAPQSGDGGLLTFTDPGGATNVPARFYRFRVSP